MQLRKKLKGYDEKCLLSKVTILRLQYKDDGWGDLMKCIFEIRLTFIISKFLKKKSQQHVNKSMLDQNKIRQTVVSILYY